MPLSLDGAVVLETDGFLPSVHRSLKHRKVVSYVSYPILSFSIIRTFLELAPSTALK